MKAEFTPIGIVRNSIKERKRFEAADVVSEIEVYPQYLEGLEGLDGFSHIVVVFWIHLIRDSERSVLKVHPRGDECIPLQGVFATRSPVRPNPIGITTARLVKRSGNILTVSGLDAIDGTPVLDIKPYIPEDLPSAEIKLPDWVKKSHK
ncbi:MAG: tRNA (N6-threonylcarbamoyladenosine(37)-N6)-methyltransferase TrmO [Dehalococcoidia bacterium]|nr:tRNA (N6-threonylcarbamoyladenosine(37)-N6)-methyltransferase TrmO [Dehalococcoidia bacterium]MDD5495300.1 tRNA (N6-threonylcarbamoyladenosine(37)-N6)-methyltransferase TrmO [Dehalococcoidia bacterium]